MPGTDPGAGERFVEAPGLRVPHMGWNRSRRRATHPLLAGLGEGEQAYFVHSYAVPVGDYTLATTDLRRPVLGGDRARQFPRHAIPSRALRRRGRQAPARISSSL